MKSHRPLQMLAIALILVSCYSSHPWRKTREVLSGLKCGMSKADVIAYAKDFRRLDFHEPEDYETIAFLTHKTTAIKLWFASDKLQAHSVTWIDGFKSSAWSLKYDLCSGTKLVQVFLIGDPSCAGAVVWLDDEVFGTLSNSTSLKLEIPLGSHQIRLEKPGFGPWSTELKYDDSSSGYDRVVISLEPDV